MNKTVITTDMSINGNLINAIDTSQYLNCDLVVLEQDPILFQKFFKVRGNLHRQSEISLYSGKLYSEVIIMEYKTFVHILNNDLNIKCDKMIVLDCLELTLHQQDKTDNRLYFIDGQDVPDIVTVFNHKFPNVDIQFLMPLTNWNRFKLPFKCNVFYKKINFDILDFPPITDNGYVYRGDPRNQSIPIKYPQAREYGFGNGLYRYKNFVYNRRSHLSYIEQFGRIIFELYYTGRDIWTVNHLMDVDDGLSEHLSLLNAEFRDGKLYIPNIESLNMNNYDYLGEFL